MKNHRQQQTEIINGIAKQIENNTFSATTVKPIDDFENDSRKCLTGVHFLKPELINQIKKELIEPLQKIEPDFYYLTDSLHLTIKNVRTIDYTPLFTQNDVEKSKKVFSKTIPKHKKFNVYFYRLLLFKNSLTLVGTTDPELDKIIFDLDKRLKTENIADDKVYANSKYFFASVTLARFGSFPSKEFINKVEELSKAIKFNPYKIDWVSLVTSNAVLKNKEIIGTWELK